MISIVVCGDRNWKDEEYIYTTLDSYLAVMGKFTVIEGGCSGADTIAWNWALSRECNALKCEADWDTYGKAAGPIRNREMLDMKPNLVIAFHPDIEKSRGTKDCITEAKRRGIQVDLYQGR